MTRKITATQAAVGILFTVLVIRLFFIQVVGGPDSARAAEEQQNLKLHQVPRRGDIVARDGTLLATSEQVWSLWADPARVELPPEGVGAMLAASINLDPRRVADKLGRRRANGLPYRDVWLARFLSDEEVGRVRALKIKGLHFRLEYKRRYPNGPLLAHVLGFVTRGRDDRDDLGLEGLEVAYDDLLHGTPGNRKVVADARRKPIPSLGARGEPAKNGQTLVLTIDAEIQAIAEAALREAFEKWKARSATAIVLRPTTGEVLAMASMPTYDPNRFADSTPEDRRNRAIGDAFDPGSTFKPFTLGVALAEGVVTPETMVSVTGPVGGRTISDHVHAAQLSVYDVLVKSSNVGAARIGMMLKWEQLRRFVVDLGFGRPTGVGLRGEAGGRVTPMERWNKYSQTSVSFGQEITVTSLQLATAYCALANSGMLMKPYIVSKIEDDRGRVVTSFRPEEIRRVLPYRTVRQLRSMLEAVVQRGTGKKAATRHYTVGGKTGTAQKALPDGRGYSQTDFVAYFAGFAPVKRPEICVLVAVDTPRGNHYGGTVAAPVFSAIVEKSLLHLQIQPDKK